MPFAHFLRYLTACSLSFYLVGCANLPSTPQDESQPHKTTSEAVKARINLALAYLEQNDFPKAKQNIDKALNHDNQDYLPYSVLAYYYQQIGEQSNAEITYQKALELSQAQTKDKQPRPDVRNNYGAFLCKQGNFAQAYQQFEWALQSNAPYYHQADTLENIALCANQAKNRAKQTEALMQLEKLDRQRANRLRQQWQ